MKTYSIAEINDLDHGIPISRFEGRIKKVFEQKSGEGQYGTWYLQNLIVEDGQQEITVTWTGDDAFDAGVEGSVYSFETGYDKKEKPVGIVRDIRSKNGKKYEGVKVDNRSKIKRESSDQQGAPSAFQQTKAAMTNHEIDTTYDRIDATKAKAAMQGEHPNPRMPRSDDEQDWPEAPPVKPIFQGGAAIAPESPQKRFSMLDERQRAIIRQHSQTAAIEVLKLKQMLGELTVEDLTPSKLSQLANFFDADVFQAASNV